MKTTQEKKSTVKKAVREVKKLRTKDSATSRENHGCRCCRCCRCH